MADIGDIAQAATEVLDAAITLKKAPEVAEEFKGECLYCGRWLGLDQPKRWCDSDCRDDYELKMKGKLI